MPLSKWCQLTGDGNVGRNAERQHPTSIIVGGGGPERCLLNVTESCPGKGKAIHIVGLGFHTAD